MRLHDSASKSWQLSFGFFAFRTLAHAVQGVANKGICPLAACALTAGTMRQDINMHLLPVVVKDVLMHGSLPYRSLKIRINMFEAWHSIALHVSV